MKPILCMAVAIGLALPAAPALADEVTVKYDDLALSTSAGQRELDKRILVAARKVCRADMPNTGTRISSSEARRCIEQAQQQVKQQVATLIEQQRFGG
jgi:UrcA family protein